MAPGKSKLKALIRERQRSLREHGTTLQGSGFFEIDRCNVSMHSCYGPPDQDKGPENQDYVLAWRRANNSDECPIRFAISIADGVTSSFRSEWASKLACWSAITSLVGESQELRESPSRSWASRAFDAAGAAIGEIADILNSDPQSSCPRGQFSSTWKYILRKGAFLQTTLALLWSDRERICVASVGDSGAVVREYGSDNIARSEKDQILAACDLQTQQVQAIGPLNRSGHEFDCWFEGSLCQQFLTAIHTDGLGRGLGDHPLALLEQLDALQLRRKAKKEARRYLDRALAERPKDFDDNLTLAVVRRV